MAEIFVTKKGAPKKTLFSLTLTLSCWLRYLQSETIKPNLMPGTVFVVFPHLYGENVQTSRVGELNKSFSC